MAESKRVERYWKREATKNVNLALWSVYGFKHKPRPTSGLALSLTTPKFLQMTRAARQIHNDNADFYRRDPALIPDRFRDLHWTTFAR